LPPEKLAVKPNFVARDPMPGKGDGQFAIFVGRLTAEKGVRTMLTAWRSIRNRLPLRIIGDGPMSETVAAAVAEIHGVSWLGERPHSEVMDLIGQASILVMPSEWYEPFGLAIIEAYAKGTPVLGANIGSIGSLVQSGHNGFLFEAGNPIDLTARVEDFLSRSAISGTMRRAARQTYEEHYTADRNYDMLMRIYESAIELNRSRHRT
jgi:glycosyltransferase involved in cell wall biosynthesis